MKNKEKEEIIEALKHIPFYEEFKVHCGGLLRNRYPIKWIAADGDGRVYCYSGKPYLDKRYPEWCFDGDLELDLIGKIPGPVKGWKNSLINVKLLRGKKDKEEKEGLSRVIDAPSVQLPTMFKLYHKEQVKYWEKQINTIATLLRLQEILHIEGESGATHTLLWDFNDQKWSVCCDNFKSSIGSVFFSLEGAHRAATWLNSKNIKPGE